jgi:hypothetical protein
MRTKFHRIFERKKAVIGTIHFPPLLGYPGFPGFDVAAKNARADLRALGRGGVDGIIFENNYDIPHKIFVDAPVVSAMTFLGEELRTATKLPTGVSVLWNDYRAALSIAKVLGLQFIRVPVFVDRVRTAYGVVDDASKPVAAFRKSIGAEDVALFTDIHVKHAKLLSRHSLAASAKRAIRNHSDALIVTGEWTGRAPDIGTLRSLRAAVGPFPILVGSGADAANVRDLLRYADGIIVSTSLKEGTARRGETNVKAYGQRIDVRKVKTFVHAAHHR